MKNTIGEVRIKIGKKKRRDTPEIKQLREEKCKKSKEYNQAIRQKDAEILERKQAYYTAQNKLHTAIDENNKDRIRKEVNQLIQEGNTKSNKFWFIKAEEEGKNRENYNLITEEGEEITDPEKAKEYTADYYEDLLQARDSRPQYVEWTQKIKERIKEIEKEMENKPPPPPISTEEMRWVKSRLKRHKATSGDLIPNEAFIEATWYFLMNVITSRVNGIGVHRLR